MTTGPRRLSRPFGGSSGDGGGSGVVVITSLIRRRARNMQRHAVKLTTGIDPLGRDGRLPLCIYSVCLYIYIYTRTYTTRGRFDPTRHQEMSSKVVLRIANGVRAFDCLRLEFLYNNFFFIQFDFNTTAGRTLLDNCVTLTTIIRVLDFNIN